MLEMHVQIFSCRYRFYMYITILCYCVTYCWKTECNFNRTTQAEMLTCQRARDASFIIILLKATVTVTSSIYWAVVAELQTNDPVLIALLLSWFNQEHPQSCPCWLKCTLTVLAYTCMSDSQASTDPAKKATRVSSPTALLPECKRDLRA